VYNDGFIVLPKDETYYDMVTYYLRRDTSGIKNEAAIWITQEHYLEVDCGIQFLFRMTPYAEILFQQQMTALQFTANTAFTVWHIRTVHGDFCFDENAHNHVLIDTTAVLCSAYGKTHLTAFPGSEIVYISTNSGDVKDTCLNMTHWDADIGNKLSLRRIR
jgi:hypothetical protein